MLALDTNILVRLLTDDDAQQAALAQRWLQAHASAQTPAWVDHVVLCELAWVLERSYGYPRGEVARAIAALLEQDALQVESPELVRRALQWQQSGPADFSDYLLAARAQAAGFPQVLTLDKKAARTPSTHQLLC